MRSKRSKRQFKKKKLYKELKLASRVLGLLILVFLIVFIFSAVKVKKSSIKTSDNNSSQHEENIKNNQEEEKKDITIDMAITGDIMCHNTVYNDAFDSTLNTYDFSHMFQDIKPYIQNANIAIGNLETTFAGSSRNYSGYPTFNTPEQLAYNLKDVGFDVVSTANNHCYDKGYSGLESTINYLDDAGIAHTGTFKSEEAQKTVLVQDVNGIKIAFLSFTYGTNGIPVPSDKTYSVNLNNTETILSQLSLAKEVNPDLICVSIHWGTEYQTTPNSEQINLADLLFQNGADLVIGNHPHVLQKMEKKEINLDDGTTKEGFIVYSLGNFISGQTKTYTKDSAILNLSITKTADGKIHFNQATYKPIYTYINKSLSSKKFKLIDLNDVISKYESGNPEGLTQSLYNTFSKERENVIKILGEEIK